MRGLPEPVLGSVPKLAKSLLLRTGYTRSTDTWRSARYKARICEQQLDAGTGSEQWGCTRPSVLVGQLRVFTTLKRAQKRLRSQATN